MIFVKRPVGYTLSDHKLNQEIMRQPLIPETISFQKNTKGNIKTTLAG
jgi:hypothetical protein